MCMCACLLGMVCIRLRPQPGRIPERCRVLDRDGLASPGEFIRPGDVYINMQRPVNTRDPLPPVV